MKKILVVLLLVIGLGVVVGNVGYDVYVSEIINVDKVELV